MARHGGTLANRTPFYYLKRFAHMRHTAIPFACACMSAKPSCTLACSTLQSVYNLPLQIIKLPESFWLEEGKKILRYVPDRCSTQAARYLARLRQVTLICIMYLSA